MQVETPADEQALIDAARADPRQFVALYDLYFRRVYNAIAYRVQRQQDAEDLTSAVFLKAFERFEQFSYRGDGSFAAWLFRIATNAVHDFHRRQPPSQVTLDDALTLPGNDPSPDRVLMEKERFEALRLLIQSLPRRRQEVITLRYYAGLRNNEIAAVLGLDERTVASHLSRALKDLSAKVEPQEINNYDAS